MRKGDVNINKMIVFNKFPRSKKGLKYFVDNKNN